MKLRILFVLILFYTTTFAQDTEQSLKETSTWIEKPDIIIKGEELKNYPTGQLSEMLLGRLPGVDEINTANQESKTVFIVDGIVWWDIDALNINNIEEIAYYKGGLTSKLGLQNVSSAGVILITTKTAEFNQPFNAAINTIAGNNTFKTAEENQHSTLQSYNVILNQGLERFSWRTSAVFNKALNNMNQQDFNRNFQLNADLRFKPLEWLDLEANGNYVPSKGNFSFDQMNPYSNNNTEAQQDENNWNGLLVAKIQPIKGLTNEIKFLKSQISNDINTHNQTTLIGSEFTSTISRSRRQESEIKHSTILNDLNYQFNIDQDRIKFQAGAIYQFDRTALHYLQANTTRHTADHNPIDLSNSMTSYELNQFFTIHSILADFSVDLYEVLAVDIGVRGDKIKNDTTTYHNPYYHASLNLKKVFFNNVDGISKINVFHSSGKNNTVLDDLTSTLENDPITLTDSPRGFYLKHLSPRESKGASQNYGLKSSFLNNSLYFSIEWYDNTSYTNLYLNIPTIGPVSNIYLLPVDLKNQGWRVWSSIDISKNSAFKWSSSFNIYRNKARSKIISESNVQSNSILPTQPDPAIQTGMQQRLSYAGFSLNLNGYAYFNHPEWEITTNGSLMDINFTKSTLINLNYAYFGYDFKKYIEKSSFKSLNIGIVSRNNLYHEKNLALEPSRTIGIALNATL